jgi:hypothetical protein
VFSRRQRQGRNSHLVKEASAGPCAYRRFATQQSWPQIGSDGSLVCFERPLGTSALSLIATKFRRRDRTAELIVGSCPRHLVYPAFESRDRADRQILIERPWKHLNDLPGGYIYQEQIRPVLHILEARIGRRQSHRVPVGIVISRTRPEQRRQNRAHDPQAITIALRIDPRVWKPDRMPRVGTAAEKVRGANASWPNTPRNNRSTNGWPTNNRAMNNRPMNNLPTDNWSTDDRCGVWGRPSGGPSGWPVLVSLGHGQGRQRERKYRRDRR